MKIPTRKSQAPEKATDTEEVEFWRAKKKIAYQHIKTAKNTNNTGWVKMLKKRINKYDSKIKSV